MSAQLNTLPAIRALLWERWRVMRWVMLAAGLAYGSVVIFVRAGAWANNTELSLSSYEGLHFVILPIILFHGVVCNFIHRANGKNFRLGVSDFAFRLPVSNLFLSVASLMVQLLGMVMLLVVLSVVDALTSWPFVFTAHLPLIGLLLAAAALIALLHAGFMLTNLEPFTIPALLVTPWAALYLLIEGNLDLSAMSALMIGLVLSACLGAWAYRLRRTGVTAGVAFILDPRNWVSTGRFVPVPRMRRPIPMLMWYEWRLWGWIVIGMVAGAVAIALVLPWFWPELRESEALGAAFVGTICFAVAIGAVQSTRDSFFSTQSSTFWFMRPLPTRMLALGRVAGSTSILVTAALLTSVGALFAFDPSDHEGTIDLVLLFFFAAWILMHAFAMALLLGCLGNTIALFIWMVLSAFGLIFEDAYDSVNFYTFAGLSIATIAWMTTLLVARGVVPIGTLLLWGVISLGLSASILITANTIGGFWKDFALLDDGVFLLMLASGVLVPIIWQVFWLHASRHGGLDL